MIKVVAFDFDNTLYNGVVYENWQNYCEFGLRNLLSFLNKEEIEQVIENQLDYADMSIIATIEKFGLTAKDWLNYRDTHLRKFDTSNAVSVSSEVLESFAKKYTLYITTHNRVVDVERVAKSLNINLSLFKEIIIQPYKTGFTSKKFMYQYILEKEQISNKELFVIGDSQEADINPATELGIRAKKVKTCAFTLNNFEL